MRNARVMYAAAKSVSCIRSRLDGELDHSEMCSSASGNGPSSMIARITTRSS